MKTVLIKGKTLRISSIEDYITDKDSLGIYSYKTANNICKQLNIQCPYISLVNNLVREEGTVLGGITYTPKDLKGLDNNLVIMSTNDYNPYQFTGTLAHEMRHIYQAKFNPEINKKTAKGFKDALNHPAEIDADGYGIWYISNVYHMTIEKAAEYMCPEEKKKYPNALKKRIDKAYEIKAEMDARYEAIKQAPHKPYKTLFLNKLKQKFNKKGN